MPINDVFGDGATACPPKIGKVFEAFPCPYKPGYIRRILILNSTGGFPFTSLALLQSEAIWTALLALDTPDFPDNALLTPNITEFDKPPTAPEITVSNNGSVNLGRFPAAIITWGLQDLSPVIENQIKQTIEENGKSMAVLFITSDNKIMYLSKEIDGTNPLPIPVNLGWFGSKSIVSGVGNNIGELHIDHEKEFSWWAIGVTWDILNKQAA